MSETTTLSRRIQEELVQAMKARDTVKLSTLRLIKAAMTNKAIELRAPLSAEQENQLLKTMVKQRSEAMEMYEKGGRPELASKEAEERRLIETYLPEAIAEDEVREVASATALELGASSPKDMGKVMKETMTRLAETGKTVDGKLVSAIVREILS